MPAVPTEVRSKPYSCFLYNISLSPPKVVKRFKTRTLSSRKKRDLNQNKCLNPMEIELHGISFSIVISGTYKFCFLLINSSGVEICMQFTIIPFHKCLNLVVFWAWHDKIIANHSFIKEESAWKKITISLEVVQKTTIGFKGISSFIQPVHNSSIHQYQKSMTGLSQIPSC